MNKIVLDASGLLALIKSEQGAEIVEQYLGYIVMSSINVSEVIAKLYEAGMAEDDCHLTIDPFIDTIISFDLKCAYEAAKLKELTKDKGLSLGDRACIALGIKLNIPILTADKIWGELSIDNANIKLIR